MWVTEIGWAGRRSAQQPVRQGKVGQAKSPVAGAERLQAPAAAASTCAACSGTRGATRGAATRSAIGAVTPGCGPRTGPRSPPGGRSSGSPAGDPQRSDRDGARRRADPCPGSERFGGGAEALLRRHAAGPAGCRRLRGDGRREGRHAALRDLLGGDRPDPGAGRHRLVDPRWRRRRGGPQRNRDAAVHRQRAALGREARRPRLPARRVPDLRAARQAGAGGVAAVPARCRRSLRAGRRVLGRASWPPGPPGPRLADLERAELAELLQAEAEREGLRQPPRCARGGRSAASTPTPRSSSAACSGPRSAVCGRRSRPGTSSPSSTTAGAPERTSTGSPPTRTGRSSRRWSRRSTGCER